jgi:regulation of enolase protein 1 (concanavalin A-like superfamily)
VKATSGSVNGSASVTITGTLPSGWTGSDIGSVGVPGGTSYNSGTYTVNGSGTDIGGTADAFQFGSQTLTGDGEIRARVTSQTNTNAWAKAGVMIRNDSTAGSVNALVALTPGHGFTFQSRAALSGTTTLSGTTPSNTAPNNWVRLTRSGTLITAYVSSSGTSWTQMGTANLTFSGTVSAGLALTSDSNSVIGTATFDNAGVTPFPSPWQSVDIGSPGLQGSADYYNGAYTLKGAGTVGSTADKFHYVYQSLTGSGTLSARISTLQGTGTNSRVGVMIRNALTTNSQYAFMAVSGTGAFESQYRSSTGGSTTTTASGSGTMPNLWVEIVRSGNTLSAYKSANGTSWTLVKSISITMGTNIYIGFVDASGTTTTLNTSIFDNVTFVP